MSDGKATLGPFEVSERFMTNDGQRAIMAPDAELGRKRVALVDAQKKFKRGEGWKLDDDPERDANARLFSASYELLAALKTRKLYVANERNPFGHDCMWCDTCFDRMIQMENEAIAKAEPEEWK